MGGGIAGLALGCALASKSRATCILEARQRVTPSKRGLTLQPNGMEALENLGLLDPILRIGTKTPHIDWFEIEGKRLATLDYSILDHPYNFLLTVVPSDLELALRDLFLRRGGIIEESTLFQQIQRAKSRRIVARADRGGSPVEFSGTVLVGADGENSGVRRALQLPTHVKEYPDHFLFMLAGPVADLRSAAKQYIGLGKMIGFFPTPNSTYIFSYVHARRLEALRERGLESFKKEVAGIEPDVSNSLGNVQSWDDIAGVSARRIDVKTWVADNAALLGDAAHALDPSWAQGANLALQDTVALASTIEKCFELNDFSATILRSYEEKRKKKVKFVQKQAERTARITMTESNFYYRLGKRTLRRTGANRELMRFALEASSGLRDHFTVWETIRFVI